MRNAVVLLTALALPFLVPACGADEGGGNGATAGSASTDGASSGPVELA